MELRHLAALAVAGIIATAPVAAHEYELGPLKIDHPWARATLPGQSVGGAYLSVHNRGSAPDRLLGASTPAAALVEVHEMRMEGDLMRMRELPALDLPAGKQVKLSPGGLHLMLMELKRPLKVGDRLALRLRFEKAGEVELTLHVENPVASPDPHKH